MIRYAPLLALLAGCTPTPGPAALAGPGPGASVAVHLDGAIVEQRIWLDLEPGLQTVSIPGVAGEARPGSLWVRPLGEARGVRVVAAAFRGALDPAVLEQRHRGRPIRVVTASETIEGTLVEVDSLSIAVAREARVDLVPRAAVRAVHLERRGGSGSSIELEIEAARAGRHLFEVAYATGGLGWSAHYEVEVRDAGDDAVVRLRAAATIRNDTQVRFESVRLSLHAGALDDPSAQAVWRGGAPLPAGEQTVPFAAGAREIPARFELVAGSVVEDSPYGELTGFGQPTYGNDTRSLPVTRQLTFRNRSAGALELPPGPVTVTLRGANQPPETLQVALTGSVGPNETVKLPLGHAEGVQLVRRQRAFLPRAKDRLERYELGISNTRDQPVTVAIRETVPDQLGALTLERSRPRARLVGRTVHIELTVPAHQTETAIYEIAYTRGVN